MFFHLFEEDFCEVSGDMSDMEDTYQIANDLVSVPPNIPFRKKLSVCNTKYGHQRKNSTFESNSSLAGS